jgi:N-acetylneuraminate lyase
MYEPLHGLNSAIFTPFADDGGLNIPAFEKLLDGQIAKGVTGFFVCGSTGEGLYLRAEERKLLAEVAVKTVAGRAAVMIHVGALTTAEAVELARHAEAVGADAASSVAPVYYPVSFEGTLNHYKAIGGATGLPFFIYHVPYLTGSALTAQSAERLLEIPHLEGIKFTDAALYVLRWIFDLTGQRLSMISGPDELHLPALTLGAHGAIGTTYNLLPGAFLRLREAYFAGDTARASELQIRCNQVIYELIQAGGLGAFKAAMKLVGHDLGPVRPPLVALTAEQECSLFARLEAVGFPELAAL